MVPSTPSSYSFDNYTKTATTSFGFPSGQGISDNNRHSQQMVMYEADARAVVQAEEIKKKALADMEASFGGRVNISLPSFKNEKGAQYYWNAYDKILAMEYN
ncbi:MAG: hypothetical protein R3361_09595 [Aequorivita vladivostokensis]|nr:hypothetical protein [Aequorivita vladivostokensis]